MNKYIYIYIYMFMYRGTPVNHSVEFEGPVASSFEGHATKFAPRKAMNLIA